MSREHNRDHPIWVEGTPTCPICGYEVTCEEADTGACTQQVTPYVCLPCGWVQSDPVLTDNPNDQELLDTNLWE